jgi:hypothetical protein
MSNSKVGFFGVILFCMILLQLFISVPKAMRSNFIWFQFGDEIQFVWFQFLLCVCVCFFWGCNSIIYGFEFSTMKSNFVCFEF